MASTCGNLFLQDPLGRIWILSSADTGNLVTSLSPIQIPGYVAPVMQSPSFYWQLSALNNGVITVTPVAPTTAQSSVILSSTRGKSFLLTIQDNGILINTSQGAQPHVIVPYPTNVQMSAFPNLGLTSSVAGATPLTVSADFSIWSCTLGKFINEDTTNIIVVLDE